MNRVILLAAVAAAALSLGACQKKAAEPAGTETAAATSTESATTTAAESAAPAADAMTTSAVATPIEPGPSGALAPNANGTESTEAFITGVSLTDLYQVEAGKIAEAKGQSQGVKDFGKMMANEHAAMTNQMKHIFAATKTKAPTELGERGKRMISDLNAASPENFDKLYLNQQQSAQSAELTLLSAYAEGGESADLKPAAAKLVPKVKTHLEKVSELQAAIK